MTSIRLGGGWRLARWRVAPILGLAAMPLVAGCAALGVAAYKFGGNPVVPAHYKPKSEPMVVIVQREENPSDARLDADRIGRFVTDDLAKNKIGPMIDPSEVPVSMSHPYGSVWAAARLSATGPSTQPTSVLEMGRAAGARQVLYVDLTEFIVQQAIASEMVHGQAKAAVRILDADTGEIRWPQDSTQGYLIQVTTPYSDGSTSATEQEMRDQMCRDLSERISHLFYEWNSDQMDSGSPLDSGKFSR